MKTRVFPLMIQHVLLVVVLFFSIGPIALMFMNSIKHAQEFITNPIGIPSSITLQNLKSAWIEGNYGQAYSNSIIVGVCTIIVICVMGGLCSYALAKLEFKGKGAILVLLFICVSVPMGLFLVPLFYIWMKLHLMNTLVGLILIYSAIYLPFNIFLLRTFLIGIPKELSESASIDGCNEFLIFIKIMVPIAKPVFFTVALLVGLWTWNEFFFANAFVQTDTLRTVSTRYLTFVGSYSSDWSKISAASVITIVPFILIYLLMQNKFIDGITEGSIKG